MSMRRLLPLLILAAGFSHVVVAAPPCKTPEDLRVAFEACLRTADTNGFWKLHCWTNVSRSDQITHKSLTAGSVALPAGEKLLRCRTSIGPPLKQSNTPKPVKKAGFLKPNIPVTGVIGFSQVFSTFVVESFVEFGKGPDGSYWFVVPILVPDAKKPAPRSRSP
jgi:hypothetical protein